jgi:aminopeptidase N
MKGLLKLISLVGEGMTRESQCRRPASAPIWCTALAVAFLANSSPCRADEPYARSRDYDLQNVRTHLWFDIEERRVRGEVSENIAALRDNVSALQFDSVGLTIESAAVDGRAAKFSVTPNKLVVALEHPAARGEKHEILIHYQGQPKKGLYFILPDKNYPQQPKEIWTQGEAEDTRYYIPLYDYPNDRTTSEMILTVPAAWITVSNGRLVGVKDEADGTKTWDWKQSEPLSTYLISMVAGEFVERDDTWRGIPLRFVVPRGRESTIEPTFKRTKEMLDYFSDKLGVPYPWVQYAQTSVDDFVEGGMENTSATTLTTHVLENPKLAPENSVGGDDVTSHELAHQWFGDLVTCKDWASLWLNEGFADYFQYLWTERRYGVDDADFEFWRDQTEWMRQVRNFPVPIVNRDFADSSEYEGNIYDKAGWVLRMLREKLGDDNFFRGLHHYLEVNRGENVVTADLQKAIEQATAINVDKFFDQWVLGAGAPKFEVTYAYDASTRQVNLGVKQTQKVESRVGLFDVPVEIEIATASGHQTHSAELSEASQTISFPTDGPPLMVVFDKGDKILKSVEFKKDPAMLSYQLKNAETTPDRADAAVALSSVRNDPNAVAALGDAAQHDPFWGVRVEALRALGKIGGADAEKAVLAAASDPTPWVRDVAVRELGNFKDDPSLPSRLSNIAATDPAYRVRREALGALGAIKAPDAFEELSAAVKIDSPDDMIRDTALRALGTLGDARAVPILMEWSQLGKPMEGRQAAIAGLGRLDKTNKEITRTLISYLNEPYFDVRVSAIFALGERGDPDAIAPLEEMLKNSELSLATGPYIELALRMLKTPPAAN